MFGQAMATFIPPMLPGTVVFMRGYNPVDIVDADQDAGASRCSCRCRRFSTCCGSTSLRVGARRRRRRDRSSTVARRWWRYRADPSAVRPEVLGVRRRRRAARRRARSVLGRARLRRDPGLRADRDRADRHAEPSVRHEEGLGRQGDRRRRGEDRAGRRDPRARRERDDRATSTPPRRPRARSRTAGSTPATSARSAPDGQLFIRGRKKEMIVTPEGLNVFPEDVERVAQRDPRRPRLGGRRRADRLGRARPRRARPRSRRRSRTPSCAQANAQLDDHQKIRRALVWPEPELPRTDGTRKLKRAAIREWVQSGGGAAAARAARAPTRSPRWSRSTPAAPISRRRRRSRSWA